jgi:hypothetical protein
VKRRSLTLLLAATAIAAAGCGGSSHSSTGNATAAAAASPATGTTTAATTPATRSTHGAHGAHGTPSGTGYTSSTRAATTTHATAGGGPATSATSTSAAAPVSHHHTGAGAATRQSGTAAASTHGTAKTHPASSATTTASTTTTASSSGAIPPPPSASSTTPTAGLPAAAHVSGPTPIDCLAAAGLVSPRSWELEGWVGYDATTNAPVYIQGPFTSNSQAQASAESLSSVELVAAGGLYAISAPLTGHLQFQVSAVAGCLSKTSGTGVLTN